MAVQLVFQCKQRIVIVISWEGIATECAKNCYSITRKLSLLSLHGLSIVARINLVIW